MWDLFSRSVMGGKGRQMLCLPELGLRAILHHLFPQGLGELMPPTVSLTNLFPSRYLWERT